MGKDEFSNGSGSSKTRLTVLVVLLLLVGAAFAYDRLVVKREFDEVWAKVKNIDDQLGDKTDADIKALIGKDPATVNSPEGRDDLVVETYSWRRGLPILTYDIHVVYTKGGSDDKQYFYSAVANSDPADKFPNPKGDGIEKMENPPDLRRAGAPGDPPDGVPGDPKGDEKAEDKGDDKAEEKSADEKSGDEKSADEKDEGEKSGEEKKDEEKKDDGSDG